MVELHHHFLSGSRVAAIMTLLLFGAGLTGCAGMSDSMTSAFVDPAKYDAFDCKQLEAERKNLAVRGAELQGLMAKADTGVAGPVVAELAYRNDYISVRASSKLANEVWLREKCTSAATAITPPVAPPVSPAPPANAKGARSQKRSGSAIY